MRRLSAFALAAMLAASPALAHGGAGEAGWRVEPLAAALLLLSFTLYSAGLARMSAAQRTAIAPLWRALCYYAAAATLVACLFSPFDALADQSFAWHMAQHLILMLLAAPLLAVSNTHLVVLFALPMVPRRLLGRSVSGAPGVRRAASDRLTPIVAALVFAGGLWLWHAPRLYDAALADPALHTIEHLTFLVTSAVFWRVVLRAGDRRLDAGTAALLTVVVGFQANLLAALIFLAPSSLYDFYSANPLSDQQYGGLLMLVPASLVFVAASLHAVAKLVGSAGGRRRLPTKRLASR